MLKRFLPDIAITLGFFIVAVLFFAPATLGHRTIIPADNLYQFEPWVSEREAVGAPEVPHNALLSDLVLQNYQWKQFIRQNIEEREIPLWQPNQFAGTPFMANGQHSMLYPFSLIYYVLPLDTAFVWFTVSQLWLAAFLMYLYMRGIGLNRIAGVVAGLTIEFSAFMIVSTVHPMIQAAAAWLPFLLLMIEFVLLAKPFVATGGKPTRIPWILGGGVGLGMVHLAGHIEITYYTLLVMALYSALRLGLMLIKREASLRELVSPALALLGMVVLGFGIGAIQFIPNVEAANDSFRTARAEEPLEQVLDYSLPPRHVAKFLVPNIYGNPAHHDYQNVFTGETIQQDWTRENPADSANPIRKTDTDFGIKNYVEGGAYSGILALLLAGYGILAGILLWREKSAPQAVPYRLIFGILFLVAASFAFGTPTYALLYYGLPGIEQLHTPFRWIWVMTVAIAVLAGFGADALQKSRHDREADYWNLPSAKSPLYRIAKQGGWVLIWGGVALIAALLASLLFYDQVENIVEQVYTGLAGAQTAFPNTRDFYSYEFRNILFLGLISVAAGTVLRVSRCPIYVGRGLRQFPIWQAMAVVVILLDLTLATYDFNTYAKKEWLNHTPPAIQWLQNQAVEEDQPFRIQGYEWKLAPINANAGWQYGLQDVRGYDSLFSQDYAEMMGQITPQDQLDFNRIAPIIAYKYPDAVTSPYLDYLNVRYIYTDWLIEDAENRGYTERAYFAEGRIYENNDALPRAYTVPVPENGKSYVLNEGCEAPLDLADDTPDLLLDFIPPNAGACLKATPATITNYQDTQILIDVDLATESWLVLADNYAHGWQAFIRPVGSDDEEKKIDIERVNGNLRGVRLQPGQWTIRFDYSPASFQLGGFVSFITGMLVIFLALIWLWNQFVSEKAEQDTARRLVKNSLAPILLNLFNRGIDFAFAFIMLRILGPHDAGIYYYAIVVFGWFDIFTNFGLNTLLTREVSRDHSMAGRYLFNTSLLRLGLALLGIPVLAGVLLVRNATVSPTLDSTALIAIILLYLGLIPNSISTGLSALFYAFEKAEFPAAIATVTTLVTVTVGLGALLLGYGVLGLAGASIVTNLVTFGLMARLAYPLIKANWSPVPEPQLQKLMMRESWALMVNHLLATVFFKSDVILMEAINGVRIVGIYSTSYKWLDALNIIPAFFTMALLPVMSRQAHDDRAGLRRNYVLGIKLLVLVALPVAVITTYLARGLIGVLGGPEFLPDGAIALQIMIWSIPLGWMNSLTQYVLIALDRQRQITGAFIFAVRFNVITTLIFLPAYSYRAAAITTIFSEIALLIGFYMLLRKPLGSINWFQALWKPWLATGVMAGVFILLWSRMPFGALILGSAVYLGILWILQPFDAAEAERLASVLPRRVRRLLVRNA